MGRIFNLLTTKRAFKNELSRRTSISAVFGSKNGTRVFYEPQLYIVRTEQFSFSDDKIPWIFFNRFFVPKIRIFKCRIWSKNQYRGVFEFPWTPRTKITLFSVDLPGKNLTSFLQSAFLQLFYNAMRFLIKIQARAYEIDKNIE
jgi:hypothetical protein